MYEHRRIQASEHAGKSYLPAGRWKQVLAPNHQSNSVPHVVHRDYQAHGRVPRRKPHLTTCPRCRNPVGLSPKRVRGETGSR